MSNSSPEANSYESLYQRLAPHGQSHVLKYWHELPADGQRYLAEQIRSIDWETFARLAADEQGELRWDELARRAEPPDAISLSDFADPKVAGPANAAGVAALQAGQVAFVLVAGGQGSRLGFEHPKGMFPIGPVSGRSLFQILLEHALARGQFHGRVIPLCIMTSPQTDEETRRFLDANQWFGYPRQDIFTFCQGVIPAIDRQTHRVLLAERDALFVNPDGHGGCLAALDRAGLLSELRQRGVEYVFYGQVDNPLLQVCHPTLIGFHILRQSEMTTQVVRKLDPQQKVGNVVQIDGRTQIIEYSDFPQSVAAERTTSGGLKFWAGSIAVHVFDRTFLERCARQAETLPFHRALKKVACLDEQGRRLLPAEPNAIKFERFIFDLLPHASRAIVCEVDPVEGFAAVKNAEPAASETPTWVQSAILRLHRRWLEAAGAEIDPGVPVEISPFVALDAEQLAQSVSPRQKFQQPEYLSR